MGGPSPVLFQQKLRKALIQSHPLHQTGHTDKTGQYRPGEHQGCIQNQDTLKHLPPHHIGHLRQQVILKQDDGGNRQHAERQDGCDGVYHPDSDQHVSKRLSENTGVLLFNEIGRAFKPADAEKCGRKTEGDGNQQAVSRRHGFKILCQNVKVPWNAKKTEDAESCQGPHVKNKNTECNDG